MKRIGIFIATHPNNSMSKDGLGIYLLNMLEGFASRTDLRLVIACSGELVSQLETLLAERGLHPDRFDWIISGKRGLSKAARLHRRRGNAGIQKTPSTLPTVKDGVSQPTRQVNLKARIRRRLERIADWLRTFPVGQQLIPSRDLRIYRAIMRSGIQVDAWYCHTAFWPAFNLLDSPRLMVVPDLIPYFFPIGFANSVMLHHVNIMKQTISSGDLFITYSDQVKWDVVVANYGIDPERVTVVRHGTNRLDHFIGLEPSALAHSKRCSSTTAYCWFILRQVIQRRYPAMASQGRFEFPFLFFSSQFRPNKNVLSLLRAFEFLLRQRFIGRKLILTGNPGDIPAIQAFVRERALDRDVLFLHSLDLRELASVYYLADLAITPSLMEGGFPLPFTEALSVGTPVVMARIPTTRELVTDPLLDRAMLFDPYNWRNMAQTIEWALLNRNQLLELQQPIYQQLAQRTWLDVVDECVSILGKKT